MKWYAWHGMALEKQPQFQITQQQQEEQLLFSLTLVYNKTWFFFHFFKRESQAEEKTATFPCLCV